MITHVKITRNTTEVKNQIVALWRLDLALKTKQNVEGKFGVRDPSW